jgi:nucleolar protein 12
MPTAPIIAATLAQDPTFFGYVKPAKSGRPASRKSAKGGGKFSQNTLAKRAHGKKDEAKKQQERHKTEVAEAAARKKAAKEARSASGRPKEKEGEGEKKDATKSEKKSSNSAAAAAAANGDSADEGEDLSGEDEDDAEDNEAAIESFMADLEAEEKGLADEASSDDEAMADSEDPIAKAKAERIAKRDARLAEDAALDARPQNKHVLARKAREARLNDPRLPRTIFVGNVPTSLKSHSLGVWVEKQLGIDLGSGKQKSIIESVRYRSAALADPKIPRRAAVQKGLFHESRDSLNAYVVFTEEKYVDQALKSVHGKEIDLDGKKWKVRVDRVSGSEASSTPSHDNTNSIFVGNLPFSVNENELYALFDSSGEVDSVRIVRDSLSGMGKGIAFVKFADPQGVRNALALNGTKFGTITLPDGKQQGGREIRVMRAVENKKLHGSAPPASKGAGSKPGSAASSTKKGGAPSATSTPREGKGGVHKVKEMNRAGVMKKPRHKPRDGSAPTAASSTASSAAAASPAAAAAVSSSRPPSSSSHKGQKRSFEGEHADPTEHLKKQRVEEIKKQEKKEKKRDNKKIAPAGSNKKMNDS